jgi:hypothetical protein
MPVTAGIIGVFLMTTRRTDVDMIPKRTGPALLNIPHDRVLLGGKAVGLPKMVAVCLKDIGHFQSWA